MSTVSRLSALPLFLRQQQFWNGALNPKNHLSRDSKYEELRNATAAHRWGIESENRSIYPVSPRQASIVNLAQSILERGQWTLPTWRVEQYIANLLSQTQNWQFSPAAMSAGSLGFAIDQAPKSEALQHALVTGRLQSEVSGDPISDIWESQTETGEGSSAEREFLETILAPVLGFPLLDFLHLQRSLPSLGLDPVEFSQQRADFVLDSLRGLRLLIEVDGAQHAIQGQVALDAKRDKALAKLGWTVWRVQTNQLGEVQSLRAKLTSLLMRSNGKPHWGVDQLPNASRDRTLMTCVWGSTAIARLQYLLLEALGQGLLPWDTHWEILTLEHDTDIAGEALADFNDWFSRLRELHGESRLPPITCVANAKAGETHLLLDIAIARPFQPPLDALVPVAWTRPANQVASTPKRKFVSRMTLSAEPEQMLLECFVRDYVRKDNLREGQFEILARILTGKDVIGLLPTGAGKSLTYQLAGLLLGGLTIYVSPLKSLLQDQHERLVDLGIDLAQPISSALEGSARERASALLTSGGIRFLLVSPERFLIGSFRDELSKFRVHFGEVCQVVVDECHCVSEWGHNFRPAYLSLSRIAKERTKRLSIAAPLVALTGTASTIVLADVQRELGIEGSDSVVRAKRMDRSEIEMKCISVPQTQKHQLISELTTQFLLDHPDEAEGLLLFCRFVGGREGVLGVTADILRVASSEQTRFYCGEDPKWSQYAAFRTRIKAMELTREQVQAQIPIWALSPNGQQRSWEEVKAEVQRQFISGLPDSFRVMVATQAFGMGIDKASIRHVIHYMAPPSPEAYYQEVGRAGRDKKASIATLLFSDEDSAITDQLLSPAHSIDEARTYYRKYAKDNAYKGGDFIRTFYFHDAAFPGAEEEAKCAIALLRAIRAKLTDQMSATFGYVAEKQAPDRAQGVMRWNEEKTLEYAVVRLILLGVVQDYVKDYNGKTFELTLTPDWTSCRDSLIELRKHLGDHFERYVRRYEVRSTNVAEELIRTADTVEAAESAAAHAVVGYLYNQIERRRREASRQMLLFARKGVLSPDDFRQELMFYLQVSEKFTNDLEVLVKVEDILAWSELVMRVNSRDEYRELHGACNRVRESYPTHPGLLCISAVTRLAPNADEIRLSEEEFQAALRYGLEAHGLSQAKAMGDAVIARIDGVDNTLCQHLQTMFGIWLIQNGREHEAISRFCVREPVRDYWIAGTLGKVRQDLPLPGGL